MKDLAKRKRVMARSMRLGHCICNAKKSCPCDVFREQDLCPCAGESADGHAGPVHLMSLVQSAGCASKIDKATLGRVLAGLPFFDDPRVLVGAPAGDDAGVYRLDDETALVQTVDVFSPSADDPYTFGQIAAANSLSDVYAMGGQPITALSIVGFPLHTLPTDALHEILRGGIDKMAEAGVAVVGGHSINDPEVKAGFAVTGVIHPKRIATNAGARPGDCLILTKPLGTGIITFAAQIGRAPAGAAEAAARSMAALNREAARLMIECDAHACTDVTGFGLMGHLGAMAAASGVDVEIVWDDLPLLPGVLECLAEGIASGAVERNRESSGDCLIAGDDVQAAMLDLCFDPQTSGGLLIAVPAPAAADLLGRLHAAGVADAAVIGKVVGAGSGRVSLRTDGRRPIPACRVKGDSPIFADTKIGTVPSTNSKQQPLTPEPSAMACCDPNHQSDQSASDAASTGGVTAAERKFQEFLQATGAPGALDAKTKQAIAIALSVLARCEPCVISHLKKARAMGFSQEEIDEAAWMGIGFGGSPAMVFYNRLKKS
jgi:selenide, water dikinase